MRLLTCGLATGAAVAATFLPSITAVQAADTATNAGFRVYLSIPFHKSQNRPERGVPRLGMQLFGSVDLEDQPIKLHLSEQMPLMDLGMTQHGLGKLDFMGADILDAYNHSDTQLDFVGSMVTSIVTTGLILVAIPVGAAIYCDATECIDKFKDRAEDEVRAEVAASIAPK